jgi:integrase
MAPFRRGKIWYIRYSYGGKRITRAVGPSKRQAELALGKIKAEIVEGKFLDPVKGQKIAYGTLLDRYLKEYSAVHKKRNSYLADTYHGKHLRSTFGSTLLKDLTPDKVSTYVERMIQSGRKPATVNRHLALLKHSFTLAKQWGFIRYSPLSDVKLLRENNKRMRYLEAEQYRGLLEVLPEYLRGIVILAANTAMRREEILSLKWNQVDLARRWINLHETKNGEARKVPINSAAIELLRDLARDRARRGSINPYVFCNPLTGSRWHDLRRAFAGGVKRAGIENFRFHDLRHHAASWLTMAGVDLLTVASILGHKDLRMTQRYSHLSPEHKLTAVEALARNQRTATEASEG